MTIRIGVNRVNGSLEDFEQKSPRVNPTTKLLPFGVRVGDADPIARQLGKLVTETITKEEATS